MDAFEELMPNVVSEETEHVVKDDKQVDELGREVAKEVIKKLTEDESYKESFRSAVGDITVVGTLGFSDRGGMISGGYDNTKLNKNGKPSHKIISTAAIVGYRVENTGDKDIVVNSQEWAQGEDGRFVSTPAEVTITPGETVDLTKRDFFILMARPEYSNEFANGYVTTRNSVTKMAEISLDEIFESSNIVLRKDENGKKYGVHDDDFKVNISAKNADGKWYVLPEYEVRFGFLNNEEEREIVESSARPKREKVKVNAQNVKAAFLAKVLADSGM